MTAGCVWPLVVRRGLLLFQLFPRPRPPPCAASVNRDECVLCRTHSFVRRGTAPVWRPGTRDRLAFAHELNGETANHAYRVAFRPLNTIGLLDKQNLLGALSRDFTPLFVRDAVVLSLCVCAFCGGGVWCLANA